MAKERCLLLALAICPVAGHSGSFGLGNDALVLVGLLALARFALAAAAWDTGSGFALMGAARDLTIAVFGEALLMLALLVAALPAHSTDLRAMVAAAGGEHIWGAPAHWCGAIAFALVILVETGRQPIDNPDTHLELIVHWQGGDHTELCVVKNRSGKHRWTTTVEVEQLITELARLLPDGGIAALLNRLGHRTGKDHTWTEARVRSFRGHHDVAVYQEGEREQRGELTLAEAAEASGTSPMTVLRMIVAGTLPAHQVCKGAPWVIKRSDLEGLSPHRALPPGSTGPLPADCDQISLGFQ